MNNSKNNFIISRHVKDSYLIEHSRHTKITDLPIQEIDIMVITDYNYELLLDVLLHDNVVSGSDYSIWAVDGCTDDYYEQLIDISNHVNQILEEEYSKVRLNFYSGEGLPNTFNIIEVMQSQIIINNINLKTFNNENK